MSACLPLKLNPTHIPLKVHSGRRTRERREEHGGREKREKVLIREYSDWNI